ncbi:MAG: FHA domain-containing protein [Streptosporangiaceae bacterium]
MGVPYLEVSGGRRGISLRLGAMTVGSGSGVDIRLTDPTVARLHAELVRRGPYAYLEPLAPPRFNTQVNHRQRGVRTMLYSGDAISFGRIQCRVGGLPPAEADDTLAVHQGDFPEITTRETDLLTALCQLLRTGHPLEGYDSLYLLAVRLDVSCGDVKNHLVRLYQKLHVEQGPRRRGRLANEAIVRGLMTRPRVPHQRDARSGTPRESAGPGVR